MTRGHTTIALLAFVSGCSGEPAPSHKPSGFDALDQRAKPSNAMVKVPSIKSEEFTTKASSSLVAVPRVATVAAPKKMPSGVRKLQIEVRSPLRLSVALLRNGDQILKQIDEAVLPRFDMQRLKAGTVIDVWLKGDRVRAFRLPIGPTPLTALFWGNEFFDQAGHSLDGPILSRPLSVTRVTSAFGARFHPVLKKRKSHNGIDFGAKKGTPVFSVAEGKVVYAKLTKNGGNVIRVAHAETYLSTYMHLDGFAPGLKVGDYVKRGQTIGFVGATGRVTGAHLHYELRFDSLLVDPLKWSPTPSRALGPASKARFNAALRELD